MYSNREIMELIRHASAEKNISISELARRVGMAKSAVSRYFNETREFPLNRAEKFASALGLTPEELLGLDVEEKSEKQEKLMNTFVQLDPNRQSKVIRYAGNQLKDQKDGNSNKVVILSEYMEPTNTIDLYSKVSAGPGIVDLEPEHPDKIVYYGELPKHYDFAVEVAGDSMTPVFKDHDIIFVEKTPNPINSAIMVVKIDDAAFVKKVYMEDGQLRLVSLNPDYKDIVVNGKHEVEIVGKVVF